MGWPEYACIFQGCLPAGDYEECAYFIPSALRYMASPDGEVTLIDNFLQWASDNISRLKDDSLYDGMVEYMHLILLDALSQYDLRQNGDHVCYPVMGSHADAVLEGFSKYKVFQSPTEVWLQEWLGERVDSYEKAAWVLFLIDLQLMIGGAWEYPETVRAWSQDGELVQTCCGIVSDYALTSDTPVLLDYWDGMLRRTGWVGLL